MSEYSDESITQARMLLLKGLEEKIREGSLENIVHYRDVSNAFPNGPHTNSFEIRAIDQDALNQWCSENGFEIFIPKNIDPEYIKRGIPPLVFRKISK